jgi:cobalt-zinc-cadmium efflux system outer membrane protein
MSIDSPRSRLVGAFMAALALVCSLPLPAGAQTPDAPGGTPAHRTAASQAMQPWSIAPPSLAAADGPPVGFAQAAVAAQEKPPAAGSARLDQLVAEAIRNNPEVQAARNEREAAEQRIKPAGALDDPMLEAGIVNVPVPSWSFRQEDMTMKMLGLSQRLPYPGKRGLREEVAAKDAEVIEQGYRETVNRVVRDLKVAYFDLSFVIESTRLVERNKQILEQFLKIADSRYAVGQSTQADVLKAQTQLSKMVDELIKLGRERSSMEAELNRALGRPMEPAAPVPETPELREVALQLAPLRESALRERPQLLGLQSAIAKAGKAIDLARKDYYPDFDVKFFYGQRDNTPMGENRENMITLTVAINLPVWRQSKLDPKVAEATAMRDQALEMYKAQQNELYTKLRQQVAMAEQSLKSARLYQTAILPQARLATEAALAAYRVNRVDFLTLLDSQMTVLNYEVSYVQSAVNYNKALAEIDLLIGKQAH